MIIALIVVFIGVALFEVPRMIQKKHWRELVVYLTLLSVAFIISLLQMMDVKIPNPVKGIIYLIRDVLQLSYE